MTAYRRLHWNFALQHAADLARMMGKPLVILEILQVDYPYASHRLHKFILEGMGERSEALRETRVLHYPFVERAPGEAKGLLPALASEACCVVADEFPSFFLPAMVRAAGDRLQAAVEVVDSNGLLPLRAPERTFQAAYHFRRFLQRHLLEHLPETPDPDPLSDPPTDSAGAIDPSTLGTWPPTTGPLLKGEGGALADLPLDASVSPVDVAGGTLPGQARLSRFLEEGLEQYDEGRNHPDDGATSGLSPYLHFGNISAHEVFHRLAEREGWTPLRLSGRSDGAKTGWWGMGPGAEAFLDQLITWRELGFNTASFLERPTQFETLPEWARRTLAEHEGDPRPHLYSMAEFREARTHDRLWNAAQRQLLEEGMIHNYLRMLWGKKILEWTSSPQEALETMVELNDRFALDGRDPNSTAGIFWCLGRYDRGWPERPVYGKVRSMSSDRTMKKVKLDNYIRRFGPEGR